MKSKFTKKFILENCGHYEDDDVLALLNGRKIVTVRDFLNAKIPISDKRWFIVESSLLSPKEKQELFHLLLSKAMTQLKKKHLRDKQKKDSYLSANKFFKEFESYLHGRKTTRATDDLCDISKTITENQNSFYYDNDRDGIMNALSVVVDYTCLFEECIVDILNAFFDVIVQHDGNYDKATIKFVRSKTTK